MNTPTKENEMAEASELNRDNGSLADASRGLGERDGNLPRFTPGPWMHNLHHEAREGGRFYAHVTADGLVPIAVVPTGVEGFGREEGRANAYLIAAAPTLYGVAAQPQSATFGETLYLTFTIEGRGSWMVPIPAEARPFVEAWVAARDAALALARGVSQ